MMQRTLEAKPRSCAQWLWIAHCLALAPLALLVMPLILLAPPVWAESEAPASWELASKQTGKDLPWTLYVEAEKSPGRPAFRIETYFDVAPVVAKATLMENMVESTEPTTAGETRRVLERFEGGALIYTHIDLPLLFADRELAIRITQVVDKATGVHRVNWIDANEVLPPVKKGVLRLGTEGYWEFRPGLVGGTDAIYVSRAEVGGSLPAALGDRLMKGQAVTAVERLGEAIHARGRTQVSAPPPTR